MLNTAVAFFTFNRPEVASRTFERIRGARPNQLFLVSDAPRAECPGEAELVRQTREIVERVDWPCKVERIYASNNMGCGLRISTGITEAFERVDRLIILEDDCLPDPSFFAYCETLLERYENDHRLMSISGDNFQQGNSRTDASYYFTKYMHCWGWATWRRAWQSYSIATPGWPDFRDSGGLQNWCESDQELRYWTEIFDRCYSGKVATWDYPWLLCCWMNNGLSVVPDVNLVSNIGFGSDATHTKKIDLTSAIPVQSLGVIRHPLKVARHVEADRFTDRVLFSGRSRGSVFKRLRRSLGIRRRAA